MKGKDKEVTAITKSSIEDMQLLDVKQVAQMYGVHPRTIWNLASAGRIPQPVRLSPHVVRWRLSDLEVHIQGLRS